MRQLLNSSGTPDRARRRAIGAALIGCAITVGAHAAASATGDALALTEAAALAVQQQPLLAGLDAQAGAARDASVASAQLPDPRLFGGIRDLPIDTHEAY